MDTSALANVLEKLSIGTLIGALIAGPLANNKTLGRKYSLVLWSIVFCGGVVVQIAAQKPRWYEVMIGRIIAGLAIGGEFAFLVEPVLMLWLLVLTLRSIILTLV